MRVCILLLACAAALAGCGREAGQGGSASQEDAYERGGAPDSSNPSRQQPGSGRVDQGGGKTSDGPIDNSVPSTNSPQSGPSGYK